MRPGLALLVAVVLAVAGEVAAAPAPEEGAPGPVSVPLQLQPLPDDTRKVRLETLPDGREFFVLTHLDGREERLDPIAFADRLDRENRHRSWLFRLLNVTSYGNILWVVLGLSGQLLFTGRMLVQWLASERSRRSVIPVGFWWLSLAGSSMLLVYFVWRRDIVGVLGQATGWVIYLRNLWLIYRERRQVGQGSSRSAAVA